MEREDEVGGFSGGNRRTNYERTNEDRSRLVSRAGQDPGMRHGAHRTLVARNVGIVGMDVDRLDKAGNGNQQGAHYSQHPEVSFGARLVPYGKQVKTHTVSRLLQRGAMHHVTSALPVWIDVEKVGRLAKEGESVVVAIARTAL
jgi:hypothetical protein